MSGNLIARQGGNRQLRGAQSNRGSRFQALHTELDEDTELPSLVQECRPVAARSIVSRNSSPDLPFQQSINPYQGCEHGCIYCYARPTHAYLDLSPGLDFETRLTVKTNAAQLLTSELAHPAYQCQSITVGANTDPYQPVERRYGVTRELLQVLQRCRHPVAIITRSTLVTRDIEILKEMATDGLCSVAISITTLDNELKRRMEPRAPSASARLQTMERLSAAGIPTTLLFAPVIPALNDCDMESILTHANNAGARTAAYMLLRLPAETRDLFFEWLHQHYPLRATHVISLLRQSRDGADNDSRFGHRMRGTGAFADLLAQRFRLSCKKLQLTMGESPAARTDLFDRSRLDIRRLEQTQAQLSLFE